jgi:hypothetical protein
LANFNAPWFTEDVRDRGSYVHAAIALLVEDDLDLTTLDPALRPYLDAFQKWLTESRVTVIGCEVRGYDPLLWFAGTTDLLIAAPLVGQSIVDVKCGHVPPSVGPQTAGYARMLGGRWSSRFSLNLRNNGTYRYELLDDPNDDEDFLAALRLYHRRRTTYRTR